MEQNHIIKGIQNWILAEEEAGSKVDMNRINECLQEITRRHNSMPLSDFNGLSPEEMRYIIYYPFSSRCVVNINNLGKEQYDRIPLVRQALFILNKLSEAHKARMASFKDCG